MMLILPFVARCLVLVSVAFVLAKAQPVQAASEPVRKKLVLLIGDNEYETERTLPAFAAEHLKEYNVVVVSAGREVTNSVFDRMEEVEDADLLLVSVRRRLPPKSQMDIVRKYVLAGKPVVGIRTASHAFARGRNGQPEGGSEWPDWDRTVIGGNYTSYHPRGLVSRMSAPRPDSPLLEGVKLPFESSAWMYKVTPLAPRAEPVLIGTVEGDKSEPVAWTFVRDDGGRTFYTSLGMPADFENPSFVALLRNGVRWAAAGGVPTAGVNQLRTPADLAVDLVAKEPAVAQPVFLNFDERGRMWVVEYLQYPSPAGLNAVSRDSIWRVVYDGKKPPPPYDTPATAKFRGKDRIAIFEDVKGDGSFAKKTLFLDGLNITTSVAQGRGGVWVLSPPHLLFYPDANRDDVPDAPPIVHVEGFNFEDSHAVANSLRFGPDGWLYGAVGSTVTADIIRPGIDREPIVHMVGQGIWRYHPETRRFEVFAEGGGNTFGAEIDAKGRIYSGHNGGNTRGFHYVQGGYFRKGFEKHGELSNPYAFGYFPSMPHEAVSRFTHNFIIYQGGALPPAYDGRLIGIDPMNRYLPLAQMLPRGATFGTTDVGFVVRSGDANFRPVDIKHGPDGAVYVADWYDFQVNHYRNHEGQITKDDGRIYRIRGVDTKPGLPAFDLATKTSVELVELLRSENRWTRETAQRLLTDRRDAALIPSLKATLARNEEGQFSLEALWALNASGGLDDATAVGLLKHVDPYVRIWTVRLLADAETAAPDVAAALVDLAGRESHAEVRSQLAASAKRLPGDTGLALAAAVLLQADGGDPYLALQLWWAIEDKCATHRADVLALFDQAGESRLWTHPVARAEILPRLMRRFAAAGSPEDYAACVRLLSLASTPEARQPLLDGFEQAFEGRSLPVLPEALVDALIKSGGGSLALRVRQRDPRALAEAVRLLVDDKAPLVERIRLATTFGEVPYAPAVGALRELVAGPASELRLAALGAASAYEDPELAGAMLRALPSYSAAEQATALSVLASRRSSAAALLEALRAQLVPVSLVPVEMQERLRLVDGGSLSEQVDAVFGRREATMPESMEREIARIAAALAAGRGSPYGGREIYAQRCLACHKLHGRGGEIGPDLTSYKRDDSASLALSIVNPNAEIREGYESFVLTTKAGATHAGFLARQDSERVVLRDMAGMTLPVERAAIESLTSMGRSLMPEGLTEGLTDEEIRDLFAYLRITQPLVGQEEPNLRSP